MENQSFGINKRKDPRVDKKYCVKYYLKDGAVPKCDIAQIKDISKGGIHFWSTSIMPKDAVLMVELHVPYADEGLKIEAMVVVCNEKVKDLIYEVRLRFIDLTEETKSVLEIIEKRYHQEVA